MSTRQWTPGAWPTPVKGGVLPGRSGDHILIDYPVAFSAGRLSTDPARLRHHPANVVGLFERNLRSSVLI
jgi:hypothetical protein